MTTCTKQDYEIISKIAKRTVELSNNKLDHMSVMMDIEATHEHNCQLRLNELLEADDFNFTHDVYGIYNNLNHDTLKLENCFLPRFSI